MSAETKNDSWVRQVDEALFRELLESAEHCFDNASSTLKDAELLIENERFERGFALSILAQEEFAKCFLLSNCAFQHRWDSEVYASLTQHEKKQALVDVMLEYVAWFESTNSFALKLNETAPIPALIHYLPDGDEFGSWVGKARKGVIKRKNIDRAKQREFYVAINKAAKISSEPSCTRGRVREELDKTLSFQKVATIQMEHVRLDGYRN